MKDLFEVTLRFYEELNDFIKDYPRKTDIRYEFRGRRSVKDLIECFGVPHTEVDLILVYGETVDFSYIVKNNDRISVYPVFEMLNIQSLSPLKNSPLRISRFVLDVHLGKLARDLRMLGFDTDYINHRDDWELAEISCSEQRILLTRDRQLLMRKIVQRGLIIRSENPRIQLEEVLKRLDLYDDVKPLTRCISCNGEIQQLEKGNELYADLIGKIPPKVLDWAQEYTYCPSCLKVYWKGSHYYSLMAKIEQLRKNEN